jgi:CheY-like chemotaxis protein
MATKVLIVDDDPLMHQLYRHHLLRAGYEPLGAPSGAQALVMIHDSRPDIIVLDMMMPGMDGLTTLRELRAIEIAKNTPVIMVTANPEYHTFQKECAMAGTTVFLTKPFSPAKLLSEIQRLAPATPAPPAPPSA